MEYAIGKILFVSGTFARIKVLFYPNNGFWTSSNIENRFPPLGKVFAPNLPADYSFLRQDDIICFNYVENLVESERDDDDIFIIYTVTDEISYGVVDIQI